MSKKTKAAPNWRFERGKIACVGQTKVRVRVEFRDGVMECVCHRDSRCHVPHEFESDPDFLPFRERSRHTGAVRWVWLGEIPPQLSEGPKTQRTCRVAPIGPARDGFQQPSM